MNEELLQSIISKFGELLEQSEKRIEATNTMVCKLADTCEHNHMVLEKIVSDYSERINSLKQSNDELANQNARLIEIVSSAQQQSMQSDERIRILFDRLLDKITLGANTSKSDIHIAK